MNLKRLRGILFNGIITENPTFRLVLGMCPTLAITYNASNGVAMGLATTFVLVFSNLVISLLRHAIPERIRIPSFVIIIATFVTIVELVMHAWLGSLYDTLGMFISLIVVNCIIFARAESFAFKNPPLPSIADGLGMGLGFTLALTLVSIIREFLGNGTFFGLQVLPQSVEPIAIFVQPPGAFLVLALIIAVMNAVGIKTRQRKLVESGCDGQCAACALACDKKEKEASAQ
jgi:electron transport complex protein RnfE